MVLKTFVVVDHRIELNGACDPHLTVRRYGDTIFELVTDINGRHVCECYLFLRKNGLGLLHMKFLII